MKVYSNQSYQDLVESNCFITNQTIGYLLAGDERGVVVEEIREPGLYSVVMIPQDKYGAGHEFMIIVEDGRAFILHSYIGHFDIRYRVLNRDDMILLVAFLGRVITDSHTVDDLTIYNRLFEVNETSLSNTFTVYMDYYGVISDMGEVDRNHNKLIELSLHSRRTGWRDYWMNLKDIYSAI